MMTTDEKIKIAKRLKVLAEIYGRNFSQDAVFMMVEALGELPFQKTNDYLMNYLSSNKTNQFPVPGVIVQAVAPKDISELDVARAVANKIWSFIARYGYTNADKVKIELGDLGWSVVERMGGWVNICQTTQEDQKGTFIAQTRELVEATIRLQKSGKLDYKFSLTDFATHEDVKKLSEFVIKRIEVPPTLETEQ